MEDCVDEGVLLADPRSHFVIASPRSAVLVVCMTLLPLIPLSDLGAVVVAADAMVFQLHLEGRACWQCS